MMGAEERGMDPDDGPRLYEEEDPRETKASEETGPIFMLCTRSLRLRTAEGTGLRWNRFDMVVDTRPSRGNRGGNRS